MNFENNNITIIVSDNQRNDNKVVSDILFRLVNTVEDIIGVV